MEQHNASEEVTRPRADSNYEQFLADVWVGVVLTLLVLSCVCCVCSCLLYHKFVQWKRRVVMNRARTSRAMQAVDQDEVSLPSYTLVSGLPSYIEALEQLRVVREQCANTQTKLPGKCSVANSGSQQLPPSTLRLSVAEFLMTYKSYPHL